MHECTLQTLTIRRSTGICSSNRTATSTTNIKSYSRHCYTENEARTSISSKMDVAESIQLVEVVVQMKGTSTNITLKQC